MSQKPRLPTVDIERDGFEMPDLDGPIEQVIRELSETNEKLTNLGYTNICIEWISDCNSSWYEIWADQPSRGR
jgi:hypothetical protein